MIYSRQQDPAGIFLSEGVELTEDEATNNKQRRGRNRRMFTDDVCQGGV